jgi:hypothetical protein
VIWRITMKKVLVFLVVLSISIPIFCNQSKYGSFIGEITNNSIINLNEYFDRNEIIKLEIYIMNIEGTVDVLFFDPNNEKAKGFHIANGLINHFQEQFVSINGTYKIVIVPKEGRGKYIIKLHNNKEYFGMTEDDKKILNNSYVWLLN